MSNFGFELSLNSAGIAVVRANVGDRYVVEAMRRDGYNLGGEQSGHLVFLDYSTTGDGVIAALKVLEIIRRRGQKLSELKKCITLLPQVREDVPISKREALENLDEVQKEIQKATTALGNRGRVFVRLSGTEPLARVLVEGEDHHEIQGYAKKNCGKHS